MPERIGIISTAHGRGTGAFIVLEHLMRAWRPAWSPLLIVAPEASAVAGLARSLDLELLPLPTSRDALWQNARALICRDPRLRECSVIHAWHSRGFELAWLLGRRLGVSAAATIHDAPHCSLHGPLRRLLMRLAVRRLDALACVSRAVGREWNAVCGAGKQTVIHNGLTEWRRSRSPEAGAPPVVGFLGMYTAEKGFHHVAGWAGRLREENVDWRLYGRVDGRLEAAAQNLVREVPRAILVGESDAESIFDEIDVLVHASSAFDPYPTVLLEAARARIPCVASNLGGGAEIVAHGETGFVFDAARPDEGLRYLRQLIGDARLRNQLGAAARARFEREFRVSGMAAAYERFWADLSRKSWRTTQPGHRGGDV